MTVSPPRHQAVDDSLSNKCALSPATPSDAGDTALKETLVNRCSPRNSPEQRRRLPRPSPAPTSRARACAGSRDGRWTDAGGPAADLSGQSLLSDMGRGRGRFWKRCHCPIPGPWAEGGVGTASLAAGARQQPGLCPPSAQGNRPGACCLPPSPEPPRVLGSSCGSAWEIMAGPTSSGPGLAPRLPPGLLVHRSELPGRLRGRPPGDLETGLHRAKRSQRAWVVSRVNTPQQNSPIQGEKQPSAEFGGRTRDHP